MAFNPSPEPDPLDGATEPVAVSQPIQSIDYQRYLWQGRVGPAFWTVASAISLTVNVILIVILVLLGRQMFSLKGLLNQQLLGGLYYNFVRMDQARITTTIQVEDTIQVNDSIPVVFDLPLKQDTEVTLTESTPIVGATVYLNGQPVPLDLVLPAGTGLNIRLDMTVPVNQTVPVVLDVPVSLSVPVDIPLNQTDLHDPFVGLQEVISPYYWQIARTPDSWKDTPLCGSLTGWMCAWLLDTN